MRRFWQAGAGCQEGSGNTDHEPPLPGTTGEGFDWPA